MTTTAPVRPWWRGPTAALRQETSGALAYDFADRRLAFLRKPASAPMLTQFERGLDAPICLTWELTYACNLECAHCLSSSGRRDPRELTTEQCEAVIDELQRMQVFYVNIGGGEPTIRPDFWHLLEYAVDHQVGVKFSTNGVRITPERARFLACDRLRRRPDLAGRRDRRGQRLRPRAGLLRHGAHRAAAPAGRRLRGRQDLGGLHPAEHRAARRVQGAGRPVRRHPAADPAAPLGSRRRRVGRAAPDCPSSRRCSTTG